MTVIIELFTSPNCSNCAETITDLQEITNALNGVQWREVNIIEELDYAVELGVLSSPSIAINGQLVFTGVPSAKTLLATIKHAKTGD
ncbi:MAG: thioredoxin family protein [Cycloclasticus sp.]